jgi:hypothetical protein
MAEFAPKVVRLFAGGSPQPLLSQLLIEPFISVCCICSGSAAKFSEWLIGGAPLDLHIASGAEGITAGVQYLLQKIVKNFEV